MIGLSMTTPEQQYGLKLTKAIEASEEALTAAIDAGYGKNFSGYGRSHAATLAYTLQDLNELHKELFTEEAYKEEN